ncbi:MAG: hypothetical protein ABI824_01840 [Acidobacteriota bacterium]
MGIRGGRPSMRGSTRLSARKPIPGVTPDSSTPRGPGTGTNLRSSEQRKRRILFVCIGNSCRSQMAEGFARVYGNDVFEVHSAGLSPAPVVQPLTVQTMLERNISLEGQYPKGLELMTRQKFDIVVNITGQRLNFPGDTLLTWNVRDPIGCNDGIYRDVAAELEGLVMGLVIQAQSAMRG